MRGWSSTRSKGGTLIEVVLALSLLGVLGAATYRVLADQTQRAAQTHAQWQAWALAQTMLAQVRAVPFAHLPDYDGLMVTGDQVGPGATRPAWAAYTVQVRVRSQAWAGMPAADAWWIAVEVQTPTGAQVVLEGLRVRGV